ncbi:hypothetical protein LCGC14_1776510 [marine sediment metagenome]|uniref:Glycosyl transferase family 1 domain-containing protein n=1 Tax=marine sediment metagenome TaxID=412755 RepID=A0A0F9GWT0_9ZZZZ
MNIAVLSRSLGRQCGISEYAICLADRLEGVVVKQVKDVPVSASPVFIQYEPSLYSGVMDLLEEITHIEGVPVIDVHTEIPANMVPILVEALQHRTAVVAVKRGPRPDTWFLPHISYAPVGIPSPPPDAIHLGSFGFALPNKRYEHLIELAMRLRVPLTILAAVADATPGIKALSEGYIDYLRMQIHSREDINIISSFLTHEQIVEKLRECSHLFCTMENLDRTSGSMRLMALAGRPIISLPCVGADEVGAVTIRDLDLVTIPFLEQSHPLPLFSDGLEEYLDLISHLEQVHV